MGPEKEPVKSDKSQSDEMVRLIVGVGGLFGFILGLLGTFIGIIDWTSARKIILGAVLFLIWLFSEFLFWKQRRKRSSKKKLPWLISIFVDVQKKLDPDSKKVLQVERVFQILRWTFISFIVTIIIAGAVNKGEIKLGNALNPPTTTFTSSQTLTLTPSSTVTLTPSPKPISESLYYMIVYDSSRKMDESFHGQKKWQVAENMLVEIINGLNIHAQYSLVTVGGSNPSDGSDPCGNPTSPALPFSPREIAYNYLGSLQPQGGGSFYKAYTLAKNQLEDLPKDTIRTLIYVTGSSDSCETEDEWTALKNLISFPDSTFGIFSQIIILDDDGIKSRTLADQFNSLSNTNINAQAPQSISEIQSGGVTVVHIVNNVTNYVNTQIENKATSAPIATPPSTVTPKPTSTTVAPVENFVSPIPPTNTQTPLPTLTPTVPPTLTLLPSLTFTPTPFVQPIGYNYLQAGEGCQVEITVNVTGSSATGYFRVWNKFYDTQDPQYDPKYPLTTLPVGTSGGYLITLGGHPSQYYIHKVWFEYNGTNSEKSPELICPGLTPSP